MAKKKNLVEMLNGTTSKLDKIFTPDAPAEEGMEKKVMLPNGEVVTTGEIDYAKFTLPEGHAKSQKEEIAERTREVLKAKRGRPAVRTAEDEVNVTFKLSAALILKMKRFAIAYEEEMGEKVTQKEIVTMALRHFFSDPGVLDDPSFLDDMRERYKQ